MLSSKERLGLIIMGFAMFGLAALAGGAIMLARMWMLP